MSNKFQAFELYGSI